MCIRDRLSIDRIIVSKKPTEGRGLTVDKLQSIDKASPAIKAWGRSVARLVFVRDGAGQELCTGFLIASDLFMTNNHCIRTPTEMSSGLAEFDFDLSLIHISEPTRLLSISYA